MGDRNTTAGFFLATAVFSITGSVICRVGGLCWHYWIGVAAATLLAGIVSFVSGDGRD